MEMGPMWVEVFTLPSAPKQFGIWRLLAHVAGW